MYFRLFHVLQETSVHQGNGEADLHKKGYPFRKRANNDTLQELKTTSEILYFEQRLDIINFAMLGATAFVEHFPYLGVFLLLVLGDVGFPFPEDATLILSGFLIAQKVTKPLPTLLVVYSGLLLTDFSLYWVGKKYGRRVVEHKRFRRIISFERLSRLEEKFKRWGIWVVFFGRHLLGLRAQIFLAAGVMRMPALKFLVADAASAILTISLMVGIGYWGGNSIQILQKDVKRIEHIGVVVFMILLAGWIFYNYIKSKRNLKQKNRGHLEL